MWFKFRMTLHSLPFDTIILIWDLEQSQIECSTSALLCVIKRFICLSKSCMKLTDGHLGNQ